MKKEDALDKLIVELNLETFDNSHFKMCLKKMFEIEKVMGFGSGKDYIYDRRLWQDMIRDMILNKWLEAQMGGFKVKINEKSITFVPDFSLRVNLEKGDIKEIKKSMNIKKLKRQKRL